ncbi:flippase-like domain-containing protein [Caminibacter mediatlanticus TB-2]|uniref:Flippase-like domain-containing protein n=1 Tax=Caminibacter mediatlanticus TB-2 TaxID=391592 RepID=A0ABX5VB44_9BACT|nr:lysylphosphatidylglycerol synthase transmembrane domain-containing protein [Caminibacter mediatlanticus]QCT94026.1 flippase-like domain-containing protein [Caminibacter mediatlanticus TB-2]
MKSIKLIVKIIFIVSAFLIIFNKIDLNKVKTIQINYPLLLFLAFIFFNLSQIISALRIHKYLKNINVTPTLKKQIMLYYVGMFYNTLLPGGIGGDAYKSYKFQKAYNQTYTKIIKALLIDRISGLFAIFVLIGCLISLSSFKYLFLIVLILSPIILYFIQKNFFKEFSFYPFIYSLIIQILQGFSFVLILLSLGISTHLIDFLILFYISSIISVIPISIGGVGLRELTFLYGLSLLNLDPTIGVVGAFLFFIISLISSAFGIIFIKGVENV